MILGVIALLIISVLGIAFIVRFDTHNKLMQEQVNLTTESIDILKDSYRLHFDHLNSESLYDKRTRLDQDAQLRRNQCDNSATNKRIADLNLLLLESTYQEKLEEQEYKQMLSVTRERQAKEMQKEQIKNI